MSTELAVQNGAAVAPVDPQVDNGNWGDDEATRPEYIQLKQPTSEELDHVQNGHFVHKASGQTWGEIKMVVLQMNPTRQWKPSSPKFVKGEKALCRSNNGVFPILKNEFNDLEPQSRACEGCPKNSWAGYNRKTGEGPKPVCEKGFFILFIDEETNLPYIYTASGKGVEPSKQMKESLRSRAKLIRQRTGKMPNTYDFVVTMTSEKDGKYFKPKFTEVRRLKPEESAKFGPLFEQYVKAYEASQKAQKEEVEEGEYVVDDTGAVDDEDAVAEV
jgi:hypothetical protein